jgi:hypothetical protein
MKNNELELIWQEVHKSNPVLIYDKDKILKTITMNHCKTISKIISDVKLKIFIYATILIIYGCLMYYALVYLGLNLSIYSFVPLITAGLFLLIQTTTEIIRLLFLEKSADNLSVNESLLYFRKKLDRIRMIDFLSYLIFFYLAAILIINNYITDIGGTENFSWTSGPVPVPLLLIIILMLLLIPWLIRYQHNKRYKKIYSNLDKSSGILNGES